MKRIFILLSILFFYTEAVAKCSYNGSSEILALPLSPKISTDPTIPVGSVLYTKKFGTGRYKTFECDKIMNDQYIITSTGAEVAGVTGLQGKPVYETGIDGIGFQVSDILTSKNGSINPAVVGSTLVPVEESNNDYKFMTVWLIKTKAVIDTEGTSINPVVTFSAGNLSTNPRASDRLLLTTSLKFKSITYKGTSCYISVSGPSQVTLDKIEKNTLMSVAQGAVTPAQKNITMNVTCPPGSTGNTLYYWFNPVAGSSTHGEGIIDNMLAGSTAATNVGVIFKINSSPVTFFESEKYKITNTTPSQSFNFTADYYRASNSAGNITAGRVKAMLEVVIQEE